jgi:hypothetical protein
VHDRCFLGGGRRKDGDAGDGEGKGQVDNSVVAGAVVAGDTGSVEDENHRESAEPDVVHR